MGDLHARVMRVLNESPASTGLLVYGEGLRLLAERPPRDGGGAMIVLLTEPG